MRAIVVALLIGTLIMIPACSSTDAPSIENLVNEPTISNQQAVITSTLAPPISIEPDEPLPKSDEPSSDTNEPVSLSTVSNLSDEGPWLVYRGSRGIYGIDQDGAGKSKLFTEDTDKSVLLGPGSPSGNDLIVRIGDERNFFADLKLYLMKLPSGDLMEVATLLPSEYSAEILDWLTEEIQAVVISEPTWSPSGRYIAFVAVIDGTSSDLYSYDLELAKITRLTSGSNQALHPYWTNDGSAIIHYEGENLLSMSEEAPKRMVAIWSANVNGKGVKKVLDLVQLDENNSITQPHLMGWDDNSDLIVALYNRNYDTEEVHERYWGIDLFDDSISNYDVTGIPTTDNMDPLRALIFRPTGEMEIQSPNHKWTGILTEKSISLMNSESGDSIKISKSPVDVFIWRPDSSGFFIASDHALYMADLPDGDLVRVDSSVSYFDNHYTWVSYNQDY